MKIETSALMNSPDDLALWLENKYKRHGEIEDLEAAAFIRAVIAMPERDGDFDPSEGLARAVHACKQADKAAYDKGYAAGKAERDGEAEAWQVRVKLNDGELSIWHNADRDGYEAVLRGEGYFGYNTAEARALIVVSPDAGVATGGGEGVVQVMAASEGKRDQAIARAISANKDRLRKKMDSDIERSL